jgi:hypothetical protein
MAGRSSATASLCNSLEHVNARVGPVPVRQARASAVRGRWARRSADRWTTRRWRVLLLIPPLGLFASSAGPLGPGGALVRVGRRLPRDLPPQFPSASPDRIEHGATSPEEDSQAVHNCSISSLATEKARASGDMWQSQTTVTNRRSSAAGRPSEDETTTRLRNTLVSVNRHGRQGLPRRSHQRGLARSSHDEPNRGLPRRRGPGAGWVLKLAAARPVTEPPDPGHGQEASGGQDA